MTSSNASSPAFTKVAVGRVEAEAGSERERCMIRLEE